MSGVLTLPKGWETWSTELGIGFSFKDGERRAEVDRMRNPETGLIEWRSRTWTGADRVGAEVEFHGQDFHSAIECASEAR